MSMHALTLAGQNMTSVLTLRLTADDFNFQLLDFTLVHSPSKPEDRVTERPNHHLTLQHKVLCECMKGLQPLLCK